MQPKQCASISIPFDAAASAHTGTTHHWKIAALITVVRITVDETRGVLSRVLGSLLINLVNFES